MFCSTELATAFLLQTYNAHSMKTPLHCLETTKLLRAVRFSGPQYYVAERAAATSARAQRVSSTSAYLWVSSLVVLNRYSGKKTFIFCGTSAPLACCTQRIHARMITLGMMEAAARRQQRQQSKHYPDLRQIGIKAWQSALIGAAVTVNPTSFRHGTMHLLQRHRESSHIVTVCCNMLTCCTHSFVPTQPCARGWS